MEAYVSEWLNLLLRWLHFVAGIAWIGSSFYFIWLDNHLRRPADPRDVERGVAGEVWSVHGGGFYHAQKYALAPPALPEPLHWFKWEAYTTWLSGMFLLVLIYWLGAGIYLVGDGVFALGPGASVLASAASIVAGWLVYDALCRSPLGRDDRLLGVVLFALVALLAWGLCAVFSGRAAYIHFGAVLGTIMVANVFFVIIPGQKRMVRAAAAGEAPDPGDGARGKQRSVHNTYFTLPVLFTMISNHFAMTYAHAWNWAILVAIAVAGALTRHYFVQRHTGRASPLPLAGAALLVCAVAVLIAPGRGSAQPEAVDFGAVRSVILTRCANCHAAAPTHPGFPAAPAGVVLDTDERILAEAERIYHQTVVTRAMPIGNLTRISDAERALIGDWYRAHTARDEGGIGE